MVQSHRSGAVGAAMSAVVIALVVLAAAGFGLYATKAPVTTTEVMTSSVAMMEPSPAMSFTPASNVMMAEGIHDAFLVIAPLSNGSYAMEIHAAGLEPTMGTGNIYIVEGQPKTGSMTSAPIIAQSSQASEFEVGSDGVGQFFAVLGSNPADTFESVQLVYLGGMSMGNATVVATATL